MLYNNLVQMFTMYTARVTAIKENVYSRYVPISRLFAGINNINTLYNKGLNLCHPGSLAISISRQIYILRRGTPYFYLKLQHNSESL